MPKKQDTKQDKNKTKKQSEAAASAANEEKTETLKFKFMKMNLDQPPSQNVTRLTRRFKLDLRQIS